MDVRIKTQSIPVPWLWKLLLQIFVQIVQCSCHYYWIKVMWLLATIISDVYNSGFNFNSAGKIYIWLHHSIVRFWCVLGTFFLFCQSSAEPSEFFNHHDSVILRSLMITTNRLLVVTKHGDQSAIFWVNRIYICIISQNLFSAAMQT